MTHPPFQLPGHLRRRWPLIVAAAGVLVGLWALRHYQNDRMYRRNKDEADAAAHEKTQVKVYRVTPQPLSGTLKRIGTVRARAETNLQFGAAGRVLRFDVEKGQFVKRGALIASLDQAEANNALHAAQLEMDKAADKYFKDRTIDRLDYERVKARYTQTRLEAGKTRILAPHDGYLVEKWINAGEQVDGGTVIGKLMDKSRVSIDMDLSEDDIQSLKLAQKVQITVDAVPDFKADGNVVAITPYLKGDTRSFNVKVDVPQNPKEALNPGMFARCAIRRYEKAAALTVPIDAAAELRPKEIRVFLAGSDNSVQAKTLPILFMDEGLVEVEGLTEGDLVILHPGTDMDESTRVDVMDTFDPRSREKTPPAAPAPDTPLTPS